MANKKPESILVDQVKSYLKTVKGCKCEKRHGSAYSEAGQPDISGCYKGRRFEIELKHPNAAAEKRDDFMITQPLWPQFVKERIAAGGSFPGDHNPTRAQVEQLLQWEEAGAVAFVAYSLTAVQSVINQMIDGRI